MPAPDPEDIVWSNIGVGRGEIAARKLFTYSITLLILATSFVITYFLSKAEVQASTQKNKLLSITISLCISIINVIIGCTYFFYSVVIELLTGQERDYTVTNYQISLSLKSIIAQLVNSIIIPMIVYW